jgi:hypothetical protein
MPKSQTKNEKTYRKLRAHGDSKGMTARIANAAAGSGRKVASKGPSGSYDNWSKTALLGRAKEIGIKGRSTMNKSQLIEALRQH